MMRLAVISLIGISVMAFPCAYDTDPREPAAMTAIVAKLLPSSGGTTTAVVSETTP
ncbi:hypothetical protein [Bradyrhizobium sp. SYSU BS000235]|uniref:hypothetical protein n=1 Tax=Bradyrhizobium sp. SYSU BS000235 TaxID=3411332 RepID=UPI003C7960F0